MLESGANLGGERSGHIIILDRSTTGDGLITALELMRVLRRSGRNLSDFAKEIPDYPQITKNVRRTERMSLENENLRKIVEESTSRGYRVVIRPSGTEPVIRITVEGKDREEIEKIVEEISRVLES